MDIQILLTALQGSTAENHSVEWAFEQLLKEFFEADTSSWKLNAHAKLHKRVNKNAPENRDPYQPAYLYFNGVDLMPVKRGES